MADNLKSPDQADNSSKPSFEKGTFQGIGTFQPLKDEAVSVNQKSGHKGGGQ